jgi:aspartyl protease family protein
MLAMVLLWLTSGVHSLMLNIGSTALSLSELSLPDAVYFGAGLLVAVLTFATLSQGYQYGAVKAVRDLCLWCLMMLAVVAGYSYRDDLLALGLRVASEIAPPGSTLRADTQTEGEKAVRIRRRPDGHFIARTDLNGLTLTMLVDTGASTVVLRPADAQKIGIDIDKLRFTVPVQTANGTTYAAPVKLRRVAVGSIAFNDVDALVAKPGALRDSLLGMSFLNRLRSYEFSGDFLTLRI